MKNIYFHVFAFCACHCLDVITWILNRVTQFLVIVSGRLLMLPH